MSSEHFKILDEALICRLSVLFGALHTLTASMEWAESMICFLQHPSGGRSSQKCVFDLLQAEEKKPKQQSSILDMRQNAEQLDDTTAAAVAALLLPREPALFMR